MSHNKPHNRNNIAYSTQTPVQTYLEAKQQRDNRTWTIREGKLFTRYNGREMTSEHFAEMYPVPNPVSFLLCQSNLDGTKSYLLWPNPLNHITAGGVSIFSAKAKRECG